MSSRVVIAIKPQNLNNSYETLNFRDYPIAN